MACTPTLKSSTATAISIKPSINLIRGWPNVSLLPSDLFQTASASLCADTNASRDALQYGPDGGFLPLRKELSRWLTDFYAPKDPISIDRLCISGGASQNLARLLQIFTDPTYTRNIWMIKPTYFLACRIFEDAGFFSKMRGVPEDQDGINIAFLSTQIEQSEKAALQAGNMEPRLKLSRPWRKVYKHIIYGVPTFANPSGRLMSLDRRQELVRVARKYDALVITDDVYDMLQWSNSSKPQALYPDKACLPRLIDIDRYMDGGPMDAFGNTVSNGSFSKIVGPGCRTGWAEGTAGLAYGISQSGSSLSGGPPSQLAATLLHRMLESSALARHIRGTLQPAYASRQRRMLSAIENELLPLGVTWSERYTEPMGGYFIWLTLPEPLSAACIARKASQEENLLVIEGSKFSLANEAANGGTEFDRNIRLCFAYENPDALEEGIVRLARVVRDDLKTHKCLGDNVAT